MCTICGCEAHSLATDPQVSVAASTLAAGPESATLHYGADPAGIGMLRTIRLEAEVLGANNLQASRNRQHFEAHATSAYNLLSSPGSGKTTLLCASIKMLKHRAPGLPLAVIEGDQQTSLDAERIRATGAAAIQINTGRGCHLDARMVGVAFERPEIHGAALLFIENVGNLVCPALWDLGESAKVVVLSVTEGDDKPLKYPDMFAAAQLVLINKIDLLPHVQFDVTACVSNMRRVNPGVEVLQLSATRGDGMSAWIDWLIGSAVKTRSFRGRAAPHRHA